MNENLYKRPDVQIVTGILSLGLILILFKSFIPSKQGNTNLINTDSLSVFSSNQMIIVNDLNKHCPLMMDSETRLDNAIAISYNSLQLNYTMINWLRDSLNIAEAKEGLESTLINRMKTSQDLEIFRKYKVTVIYNVVDKTGIFLFKIIVTPDMYQTNER